MLKAFFKTENVLFFVFCVMSIFTRSQNMVDDNISPKWYYSCVLLCVGIIIGSVKVFFGKKSGINISVCILIVVILCMVQALYGLVQYLNLIEYIPANFHITGSFDNPAGFASCLSLAVPFILFSIKNIKQSAFKKLFFLLFILMLVVIILSGSRSGIISTFVVLCCWNFGHFAVKNWIKTATLLFFLILLGISIYFLKKNSVDGRILIWRCSIEMFKDSPILGHGFGGFEARYMDYQAVYFARNPNDFFAPLADTVQHPFNEYLRILINYGIIGFILLFAFAGLVVYVYTLNPILSGKAALYALVDIGVFSFFSYPFSYPFTWIIVLFSLYILIHNAYLGFRLSRKISRFISVCLFLLGLCYSHKLHQKIHAEWEWKKVAYSDSPVAVNCYSELAKVLGNNRYFLYNYAIVLFENDRLEESHRIAMQCRKYWADYDLEILLGDISKRLLDFQKAECHYQKAHRMCPCRFLPLFFLYNLYHETGNESEALNIATVIVNKPVKIESLTVKQIKYKMKQALKESGR